MLELTAQSDIVRELDRALLSHASENSIVLSRETIRTALRRFMSNEFDVNILTIWAEKLEMCDQILYEPGFEKLIAGILFRIASPEINGSIDLNTCKEILIELG